MAMPPTLPHVRLRDILAATCSFDEIVNLLWELGIQDSVAHEGISKETLATRAVDAIVHHGKRDEAIARIRRLRPHLNPAVWQGVDGRDQPKAHEEQDDRALQALTLSPSATRALVRQLTRTLDLSTADSRLMLLMKLGADDTQIDVEGPAEVFGYRLVRYLNRHRLVEELQMLLNAESGQQSLQQ
jgi:hypothetical protein